MRNIWTIAKREYNHYFISPIAYVVAFMILLTIGILLYFNIIISLPRRHFLAGTQAPDIAPINGAFGFLLVFRHRP